MRILLTGATGYIGKRLLPALIIKGHQVVCAVRDPKRFHPPKSLLDHIEVIQLDLLDQDSLQTIPTDIGAAYYLIHSMAATSDYEEMELQSAHNFRRAIEGTEAQQVIYLSGIANQKKLSKHLRSRKMVEKELRRGDYHLTSLRAGIIIGSGSAPFEIIRDLVEKLPLIVGPKWLETKSQPICITDVITYLSECLFLPASYNKNFDIGGPDILTYREMLLICAETRGLTRKIYTVPLMTPRLASYGLHFLTSTSYPLARSLVDSITVEVTCRGNDIKKIIPSKNISYREALERAFLKIESKEIPSSWKDSFASGGLKMSISDFIDVPTFGCFIDKQIETIEDREACLNNIWRIGGNTGWYCADWLWRIRGVVDKIFGGVGLRRGRTHPDHIATGDALDFWRVLYADRDEGRLLLFAEMKIPGEAWLEFRVEDNKLYQTATFRPRGVLGRLYWYSILPFHGFIFPNMSKRLGGSGYKR
ncbi:SDR family oxidoreductase [Desulfotalea psychrophila]|uniref:NAD-dependent epimerase/dehydratase domain-containing protein n=1 Tax=Desulfotalea psychrophila (strain LSv54 / DSM 12343) TaxID=177439 RepID=Q6AS69_DESPS|nr:SDR family oxidoreductase [Desulfotalea psychrophila]CAG34806.1 conserved hypothetical protein [Desulfotalea psychrophila LSv54]